MASTVNVDFNANLTRFTSAIDKATSDLIKFQTNASRISGNINKTLGAFGIGISAAGIVAFARNTIDALDNLNDLNKSTGIAVEQLAGLGLAAEQSGGDLESIANSINKLSLEIGKDEDKFRRLGITAKEPLEAFKQLSDLFVRIEDPQKRAAFAAEALGKSWAGAAPLLSEGSQRIAEMVEKGTRLSGVTKQNVEQADAFNDKLAELKVAAQGAATPLIPALTKIVELFSNATKETDLFTSAMNKAKLVATFAAPGFVAPFTLGGGGDNGPSASGKIKFNAPRPEDTDMDRRVCEFTGGKWDGKKCIPKKTGGSGAKGATDDPTKRLLDNTLASLERSIGKENDLLSSRNRFIDLYNSKNLLSIKDYYQQKQSALDDNVAATVAAYNKEIDALQAFQNKSKSKTDRADAQGKINDILDKRNKILEEAQQQSTELSIEQEASLKAYSESIQQVNADILELSGNLQAAAAIRFDQSVASLRERFTAEGNTAALQQLETLKKYTIAQAELNSLRDEAGIVNDQLANQEDRIDIARKSGATSELETLRQVSAARTEAANQLESIYKEYLKIAQASGNPRLIQDAENMLVSLEKLRAESDLVAQKFETIFVDSFSNAFTDFITGAKSAEEAFMDFANSVAAQISRLAAQDLASALYGGIKKSTGGDGFLSGVGDFFSDIFGGFFADGGTPPLNKISVVGERGPELFIPKTAGTVVPNGQIGGGSVIYMTVNTPDANSFRKSQPQIMADMQRNLNRGRRVV